MYREENGIILLAKLKLYICQVIWEPVFMSVEQQLKIIFGNDIRVYTKNIINN